MLSLSESKASELMERDVVAMNAWTSIKDAVQTLEEYSISGAPVTDATGSLVGVLSASDIVKGEHIHDEAIDNERATGYYTTDPFEEEYGKSREPRDYFYNYESFYREHLEKETVGDWMNPEVLSVELDTPISKVCRMMADRHVHRIFVVEEGKLRGVISTWDIVRRLSDSEEATT